MKIKGDIDFITKPRNKIFFCYFVGVLGIFFVAENLYFESQTNRKLKNYLRIKIALGVQQKFGLLEQDSLAIEFFSLQPTNIPSNRNVALHACSIGPP